MAVRRYRHEIQGTVQGVGFRPFIYRLATANHLTGWVQNSGGSVTIEVQGSETDLERFRHALKQTLPPLASITAHLETQTTPIPDTSHFTIQASAQSDAPPFIPPDIATCDACVRELFDPKDRRYRHPFINCTDCGPRYTIIAGLPYDRVNTSMSIFPLCPKCQTQYTDPTDRRYHAQPVACPECGPVLTYRNPKGESEAIKEEALAKTTDALKNGKIVAVKGIGGFHLMVDATNEEAVARLRKQKRRPAKPFAVLFPDTKSIEAFAPLSPDEKALLTSPQRPIVLIDTPHPTPLAPSVAPGIRRLGVMLPYTPLHHLLLHDLERPLVATSANHTEEPILFDGDALIRRLGDVVDGVLDHDRPILRPCDDSIAMVVKDGPLLLRRARGYAPAAIPLPGHLLTPVIATGTHQKNAPAIGYDGFAVLSPHVGDLENLEAKEAFVNALTHLQTLYRPAPQRVITDLHPGYATTDWAKTQPLPVTGVQHHYAHALALLAEHRISGPLLLFAFDGTGYGEDGTLWGGEVLIADLKGYRRVAHIHPLRLLGGEKAVKEPRRIALSILFEAFGEKALTLRTPTHDAFGPDELPILFKAWEKGLNAPLSSSAGRLFDGIASLTGLLHTLDYEGQSGLVMESRRHQKADPFPFGLKDGILDWRPAIAPLLNEQDPDHAVSRWFQTLIQMIVNVTEQYDLPVGLSGGVFQNKVLTNGVLDRLEGRQTIYRHRLVPPNDGGVALGQVVYAIYH